MNASEPRLTVRLPPRTHKFCVLCNADFLDGLPTHNGNDEDVHLTPLHLLFSLLLLPLLLRLTPVRALVQEKERNSLSSLFSFSLFGAKF